MDTNRKAIEKLLTEEKREISNKHLWIWGAGDTAVLYQQGLSRIEEEGFVIEGYVDSDPKNREIRLEQNRFVIRKHYTI